MMSLMTEVRDVLDTTTSVIFCCPWGSLYCEVLRYQWWPRWLCNVHIVQDGLEESDACIVRVGLNEYDVYHGLFTDVDDVNAGLEDVDLCNVRDSLDAGDLTAVMALETNFCAMYFVLDPSDNSDNKEGPQCIYCPHILQLFPKSVSGSGKSRWSLQLPTGSTTMMQSFLFIYWWVIGTILL